MLFFRKDRLVIRPRAQHNISRRDIDPDALKVLYRLADAGYKAYLVGGGVRDLLLGRKPKDFDISTDAHPRELKRLFRNCFLVGRRFRLAHVTFGSKVIEVSTFRKQPPAEEADEDVPGGLYQSSDNTFGTPEEDARRRDFTVNGLFYDIKDFSVIDYVGGLRDLDRRLLRSIGDPNIRFREDPVRMLRAVRLSARLGLRLDGAVRRAICRHHPEIANAAVPRLLEEFFRLFTHASAAPSFRLLWETRMMAAVLPDLDAFVSGSGRERSPLWDCLTRLDDAARQRGSDPPYGLRLAALYYPPFAAQWQEACRKSQKHSNALHVAESVLAAIQQHLRPPKAAYYHAAHLLEWQPRLDQPPTPGHHGRSGRPDVLADALTLARIRQDAAGGAADTLAAWERHQPAGVAEREPAHAARGGAARSRPPLQPADAAPAAATPGEETATPGDGASPHTAADGGPPAVPPSRRRRRGGRRHRRRRDPQSAHASATTSQPSPAEPPAPAIHTL